MNSVDALARGSAPQASPSAPRDSAKLDRCPREALHRRPGRSVGSSSAAGAPASCSFQYASCVCQHLALQPARCQSA